MLGYFNRIDFDLGLGLGSHHRCAAKTVTGKGFDEVTER